MWLFAFFRSTRTFTDEQGTTWTVVDRVRMMEEFKRQVEQRVLKLKNKLSKKAYPTRVSQSWNSFSKRMDKDIPELKGIFDRIKTESEQKLYGMKIGPDQKIERIGSLGRLRKE